MRFLMLCLVLLLSSCSSTQLEEALSIQDKVALIPPDDQQKLELLFQHMMVGDYFACTLFGNKPMTFQEFHEDPWKLNSYNMLNPGYYYYLEEGWKTWTQYQRLFPSKQFIFSKIPSKAGYEFLILINKAALKKVFLANRDLFEQALGPDITVEKIMYDCEHTQMTFSQVLSENEAVVGLVLGYGREGSLNCHLCQEYSWQISQKNFHPLSPQIDLSTLPKDSQTSIKCRERNRLQKRIKWHQSPSFDVPSSDPFAALINNRQMTGWFRPKWQEYVFYILPPNFSCVKDSEETETLRREYGEAMQIARETFNKHSFLEAFLEQYCKQE